MSGLFNLDWDNVGIFPCGNAVCKNCHSTVYHLMIEGLRESPHLCVVCHRVVDVVKKEPK